MASGSKSTSHGLLHRKSDRPIVERRAVCSKFGGCRITGDYVEFEVRINWFDGKKNHGRLNTMFCRHMTKCPDWINRVTPI